MNRYFLFTFVFMTTFALHAMESKKEVSSDETERIRGTKEKERGEEIYLKTFQEMIQKGSYFGIEDTKHLFGAGLSAGFEPGNILSDFVYGNQLRAVQFLLENKLATRDSQGSQGALENACGCCCKSKRRFCHHAEMLRLLVASGWNINDVNICKEAPLFLAVFCRNPELARICIESGAEIDRINPCTGTTALVAAIESDHTDESTRLELVQLLAKEGRADVNLPTSRGTAYASAVRCKRTDIVEFLRGLAGSSGAKPLELASEFGTKVIDQQSEAEALADAIEAGTTHPSLKNQVDIFRRLLKSTKHDRSYKPDPKMILDLSLVKELKAPVFIEAYLLWLPTAKAIGLSSYEAYVARPRSEAASIIVQALKNSQEYSDLVQVALKYVEHEMNKN